MFFIRYKKYPPVNLDKIATIKTTGFEQKDGPTKYVISFFTSVNDPKACLQWQFTSEDEKDKVLTHILENIPSEEMCAIPSFRQND